MPPQLVFSSRSLTIIYDTGKPLDALYEGMWDKGCELFGEGGVLPRGQRLVFEEQHQVLVKRFCEFGKGVLFDGFCQLDTCNIRTQHSSNGCTSIVRLLIRSPAMRVHSFDCSHRDTDGNFVYREELGATNG